MYTVSSLQRSVGQGNGNRKSWLQASNTEETPAGTATLAKKEEEDAAEAKERAPLVAPHEPEEWELMDIPNSWRPRPLLIVSSCHQWNCCGLECLQLNMV